MVLNVDSVALSAIGAWLADMFWKFWGSLIDGPVLVVSGCRRKWSLQQSDWMAFSMPISTLLSACWFDFCVKANFGPFAKRSRSGSEKFYDDRFLIRFAAENLVSCVAAVWVLGRDFWAALVSLGGEPGSHDWQRKLRAMETIPTWELAAASYWILWPGRSVRKWIEKNF